MTQKNKTTASNVKSSTPSKLAEDENDAKNTRNNKTRKNTTDVKNTEAEDAETIDVLLADKTNLETETRTESENKISKGTNQTTVAQATNKQQNSEQEQVQSTVSNTPSLALIELVTELRETVRRLNPKNHTTKSLCRALTCVRGILNDIDTLASEN